MNKKLCAVIAALTMSWAGQAASATLMATYTGTVGSGIDVTGVFGDRGTDLAGLSYKAVYIYDPSVGQHEEVPAPYGLEYVFGDTPSLIPHPVTSATLTIGGVTIAVAPYAESYVERKVADVGGGYFSHLSHGPVNSLFNGLGSTDSGILPGSLETTFSMSGIDFGGAEFDLGGQEYWVLYYSGTGHVDVTLLASGVPEPAAWAMMIIGFGAAGSVLRHSRKRTPTTA